MADGFLSRWSRRKLDAKDGRPVEEAPPAAPDAPSSAVPPGPTPSAHAANPAVIPAQPGTEGAPGLDSRLRGNDAGEHGQEGDTGVSGAAAQAQRPPPPTLADVQSLTPESDFSRFTASDVTPEVKNAAMKKLFADPHFNVMDGLDIYIDDYNKPDPMPESMLRSLASAEFLGLFREKKDTDEPIPGARAATDDRRGEIVAQSDAAASALPESLAGVAPPAAPEDPSAAGDPATPTDSPAPHADPDLRLQQDHAPGPSGPGQGAR